MQWLCWCNTKSISNKSKNNKCNFCTTKNINKMRRQFTKWVKIFAKHTSDKVCIKKPFYMLEWQRGCMALEWRAVTAWRLSCGCMALEPGVAQRRYPMSKVRSCGPRGDTPSPKSGAVAMRTYPMSKVRNTGCALQEPPWRDTPLPR